MLGGLANGTLSALPCPTTASGQVSLGFTMFIPSLAQGLGFLNFTLNATDQSGLRIAFCVDLLVTL